jgi:tripartite ATP-independent transporter DctP family solute receptor
MTESNKGDDMKMKLKTLALALTATFAAGVAQAAEFRSADVHNSDDYPTVAAVKHMSQLLEQRSGGKHKIKVFNKGALGSEKETIDQVKIGALDMTRVNIAPMNSLCAKTMVPTMPFLFRSIEHMRKTLDGPVGDEILKSCEDQGFIGLAFYDSGARSIYGKKPVRSIADTKGMKIRVQQSDLWVSLLNAMGANATPMPIAEVYTALKTGLIDAAENNIPSYDGFKHYEAVKYYSRTEHSMAPEMLLMSKVAWDKLPKADQDMIRAAAKESVAFQRKKWDEQEAKSLAVVKGAGAEIVDTVDKASFQAAMGPVYDKFITTPDLKRLVKAVQDAR